jgi:hypothetical protein
MVTGIERTDEMVVELNCGTFRFSREQFARYLKEWLKADSENFPLPQDFGTALPNVLAFSLVQDDDWERENVQDLIETLR